MYWCTFAFCESNTIKKKNSSRGQMLVLVSSLLDCENLMTRGLMAFMETSKVTCLSRFTLKSCVEVKYPNDHVCASTNEVWKELNVYEAWVRICQVVFKKNWKVWMWSVQRLVRDLTSYSPEKYVVWVRTSFILPRWISANCLSFCKLVFCTKEVIHGVGKYCLRFADNPYFFFHVKSRLQCPFEDLMKNSMLYTTYPQFWRWCIVVNCRGAISFWKAALYVMEIFESSCGQKISGLVKICQFWQSEIRRSLKEYLVKYFMCIDVCKCISLPRKGNGCALG